MKLIDELIETLGVRNSLKEETKKHITEFFCPNDFGFTDIKKCHSRCQECWNREVKEMKSFQEFCHDNDCTNCKLNEYIYMDKGTCRDLYAQACINGGRLIIDLNEYEESEE